MEKGPRFERFENRGPQLLLLLQLLVTLPLRFDESHSLISCFLREQHQQSVFSALPCQTAAWCLLRLAVHANAALFRIHLLQVGHEHREYLLALLVQQ